jgi:hypothetical protein
MPQLAIDGFPGGLNLSTNIFSGDPFDIPPEDLTVALDLSFLGDRGQLMCRFGDTLLNNALPAGDLAYIYYSPSLDRLIFGGPRSGQAYSYSLGANTLTGLLYNVASGLASPFAFCLCDAPVSGGQGPVYGVVPLNVSPFAKAIYWDGAAASFGTWTASVGTVPIARFYLWAGNRMWAFGEPGAVGGDAANTYYWSELGDPRNWPAANVNKLDPGDGDRITAATAFGAGIIIGKQHKLYQVYDLDTGANRALTFGAGVFDCATIGSTFDATRGRSVYQAACATPIGVIFLDPDQGFFITDGSSVKPLENGRKVDVLTPISLTLTAIYGLVVAGNSVLMPTSAVTYEYDVVRAAWLQHSTAPTGFAVKSVGPGDRTYGFKGSRISRFRDVANGPGGVDLDGVALNPSLQTTYLHAGTPDRLKRFGPLIMSGLPLVGQSVFTYRHDFVAAGGTVRNFAFPNVTLPAYARQNDLGVSRAIQFALRNFSLLDSMRLDYRPRGRR